MPSLSMVDRLLEAAEILVEARPKSAAFRRRSVSTAYYAVFHALAQVCVESLLPNAGPTDENYARVYRSLDHGPLRNAFKQAPLRDHAAISKIGLVVGRLQEERHRADYSPPDKDLFSKPEALELIAQARITTHALARLRPADCRLIATCLLFKERKS